MKRLPGTLALFCTLIGLAAGIGTVAAHHSAAMFDQTKLLTLTGSVVELRWTNPHVTMLVNGTVKDGDQPSDWLMETTSPGNLMRVSGWGRNSVRVGDKVVIDMAPLRDPEKQGGLMKKVTLAATGQSFDTNIRDQEKPDIE
ncbi:MAG: DUF6152 family protein [Xanthobacteraceae bacterium]|jgi:hypothetical protein